MGGILDQDPYLIDVWAVVSEIENKIQEREYNRAKNSGSSSKSRPGKGRKR